jgi:hypothetical protein
MEIPISVKYIDKGTFSESPSVRELIFPPGTQITKVRASIPFHVFVIYLDDYDVKQRRRQIQLCTLI